MLHDPDCATHELKYSQLARLTYFWEVSHKRLAKNNELGV